MVELLLIAPSSIYLLGIHVLTIANTGPAITQHADGMARCVCLSKAPSSKCITHNCVWPCWNTTELSFRSKVVKKTHFHCMGLGVLEDSSKPCSSQWQTPASGVPHLTMTLIICLKWLITSHKTERSIPELSVTTRCNSSWRGALPTVLTHSRATNLLLFQRNARAEAAQGELWRHTGYCTKYFIIFAY